MNFFLREAWHEMRCGLRGGVIPLVYVALTGYLLMVITSADNLRSLGAVDVPRNAPALVYLMTAGMAFFLFFAWAWVFAQPVVRDRHAQLHELVLSAPRSLRQLLLARYLGALGVALVLGTAQFLGFWLAPALETMGAIPPGSVATTPWLAFGWAWLVFTLPLAAGCGALYYTVALYTRSVAGPFAVSAVLMGFWMVAMIVLKEGHADPFITALVDPSGFAEAERQVIDRWTPHDKRTAFIALTPGLLLGRLAWSVLPVLVMTVCLLRLRRESLLHGQPRKRARRVDSPPTSGGAMEVMPAPLPGPVGALNWWHAARTEALWQVRLLLGRRSLWIAFILLTLLAAGAAFVHGVQHGYGPMLARTEFISPMLVRHFYLIIVFMSAAMIGLAARRDLQAGLRDMFDAAAAPDAVRLAGRTCAALVVALLCVSIPAGGASLVGWAMGVETDRWLPFAHQMSILLPAILELAAVTLLLHTLIGHAGTAHAASMLAAFIMVVNFEVGLVSYPPYQIGRGVHIALSGLTGLAPWLEKIALGNAFKLGLVLVLLALAAALTRRGLDQGWRQRLQATRRKLAGWPGLLALTGLGLLMASGYLQHQRFVAQGGYQTRDEQLAGDARWEGRWRGNPAGFSLAGGEVRLTVRPQERLLQGYWRIDALRIDGDQLHAQLPPGLSQLSATLGGQSVPARLADDHLILMLPACRDAACTLELNWQVSASGWTVVEEGKPAQPAWLVGDAFWLRARDLLPRLGLDGTRVIRSPAERSKQGLPAQALLPDYRASLASSAAAPAGDWRWRVELAQTWTSGAGRVSRVDLLTQGRTTGLLDFVAYQSSQAQQTRDGNLVLVHDRWRRTDALAIARDLQLMSSCVSRRLGRVAQVSHVLQWPRGLPVEDGGEGNASLSGAVLLLSEQPHWDVSDQGSGRLARRADIAAALARRGIADRADLREGVGSTWLDQGLPGALGLLCVAESDGVAAMQTLLTRAGQMLTQDLARSDYPVTTLAQAKHHGWSGQYAALAALNPVADTSPRMLQALVDSVRDSGDPDGALAQAFGPRVAELWRGPPNAVELQVDSTGVHGQRWHWRDGGWQATGEAVAPRRLQISHGQLSWHEVRAGPLACEQASSPSLVIDDWPAYEREPKDNLSPGCAAESG